jgi:hypothetical protein
MRAAVEPCDPLWNLVIRVRRLSAWLPLLEAVLAGGGSIKTDVDTALGSNFKITLDDVS